MEGTMGSGDLELEVTDFGPIAEARIDLRPLTVFVGPSNTGKSYLAILIYALHQFFGGSQSYTDRRFRRGYPFSLLERASSDLSDECVDALVEMARSREGNGKLRKEHTVVLPPPVSEAIRSEFGESADMLAAEIGRCFGIGEVRRLVRKGRKGAARIVMRRRIPNCADVVEHEISLARKSEFRATIPAEVPIPVDSEDGDGGLGMYWRRWHRELSLLNGKADSSSRKFWAWDFLSSVGDVVSPSVIGSLHLPAYYLPADRTGVMHAHRLVVSALIASAPGAGLRPAPRTSMLSGVLADFLEQLIEVDRIGFGRRKAERDFGKSIEKDILDGSVRIDRPPPIEYPSFVYRPRGWKDDLALANASSMVSELAPVVLYLRHVVEPGNVLIVEEPESHLHPAMQVALTRQLAALVKKGIRVIVTTHSEWMLDELANIVRRSELSRAERGDDLALGPDQVGAWLFEPKRRPKGSVVRESRLDDSGLYPSGYDDVAHALHNEWAGIASRIEAVS